MSYATIKEKKGQDEMRRGPAERNIRIEVRDGVMEMQIKLDKKNILN